MTAENSPTSAAPDTIVLIHGLWVTPRSWEKWVERYEGLVTACSPRPTQALRSRSKRSTRIQPRLRQ
jgi:hypothetical protein